jgi:hypothetical protein
MFDLSQPIHWQVIVGTIGVIFAMTAVGVLFVRRCVKKDEVGE